MDKEYWGGEDVDWFEARRQVERNKQRTYEQNQVKNKTNSEKARRKLETYMKKHITTTMIGALDKFEKEFGETVNKLPEGHKRWASLRKAVLDNGNHQLRLLLKELEGFDVNWQTYHFEYRRGK